MKDQMTIFLLDLDDFSIRLILVYMQFFEMLLAVGHPVYRKRESIDDIRNYEKVNKKDQQKKNRKLLL